MILAAGRGERLRPITDAIPKPLVEVGGKPLVVRQVEALARAGHRDIAINASHLAGKLLAALGDRLAARNGCRLPPRPKRRRAIVPPSLRECRDAFLATG